MRKIRCCDKCFAAVPHKSIECPVCGYGYDATTAICRLVEYLADDEIHYVSKANSIAFVKKTFQLSERVMADQLPISKSEINRMLKISRLPKEIKEKAVLNKIEKWVLIRLSLAKSFDYNDLYHGIMSDQITKHGQVKLGLTKLEKKYN